MMVVVSSSLIPRLLPVFGAYIYTKGGRSIETELILILAAHKVVMYTILIFQ